MPTDPLVSVPELLFNCYTICISNKDLFFFFPMQGRQTSAAGVHKVGMGMPCSQASGAPRGFAMFKQGRYGRYNLADHSTIIMNTFIGFSCGRPMVNSIVSKEYTVICHNSR